MKTLTPGKEAIEHLMLALIKTRSTAAESGYLDIMGGVPGIPGTALDPWVSNPQTVEMLQGIIEGTKEFTGGTWMNLAYVVSKSPTWAVGLHFREVEMPSVEQAMKDMQDRSLFAPWTEPPSPAVVRSLDYLRGLGQ